MGTVFKWLAGIFIGVLVLTGICIAVLTIFVDEESVKTQLTDVARRQTGGELTIDGQLGWSIFPQLGVSVDRVQFTPADEQKALATIGTLRLGVDFLPLFRGQVKVGEVTLKGVRLDLVKGRDGAGNWEKLQTSDSAAPEEDEAEELPAKESGGNSGIQLEISRLNIEDTEINYRDLQSGDSYQLTDLVMQSKEVNLDGESFPANLGFTVNVPDASMIFELEATLSGDMENQQFRLRDVLSTIAVSGAATGGQTITTRVSTTADIDLKADRATLDNLRIELAELVIAGSLSATQLTGDPRIAANLQSEAFDPRALMTSLGQPEPPLKNPDALRHARFGATVNASASSARIDDLSVELDQTRAGGSAAVTDLKKQAVTAKLSVDKINIDDYQMAASGGKSGGPTTKSTESSGQEQLLPLETLRSLNLDAALNIGTLIASGVTLSKVDMKVSARNGLVNLSRLNANLYQGTTKTSATIDARSDNPAWKIETRTSGVQAGPLLKDASEIDWIEGMVGFNGSLTTQGNTQLAVKKNLKGPASFSMSEGLLKEMNLERTVCQGIALINQKTLSQSWGPNTELNTIEGKLQFGGGKVVNKSLTGGLKNTHLKGSGEVDILREKVDYQLGIRILGTMREVDPACEVNKRYRDLYWPLRCKGKLSDEPKELCGVDESGMKEIANKMLGEEIKQRAGDDLEKKATDEINRFLRRL